MGLNIFSSEKYGVQKNSVKEIIVIQRYLRALKSSIFVVHKAAAPKIGVEFRQGSIGTIRSSLATPYDVWRRRATLGEGCSCSCCCSSPHYKINLIARRRQTSYDVARLCLMAPMHLWQNSTPVFGAAALCTTRIDNSRAPLLSISMIRSKVGMLYWRGGHWDG